MSGIALKVSPDGVMTVANAGHPPGVLLSDSNSAPVMLESSGPPLGWFPDQDYEETTLRLVPGATAILYTDGLTECIGAGGIEFGTHSIVEIAQNSLDLQPETIFGRIIDAATGHARDNLYADDVSAAVIRYQPPRIEVQAA